jgi:hypothetical protein
MTLLNTTIPAPEQDTEEIREIPKSALPNKGLACFGAPGVGKSKALRGLAWLLFLDEIPTVLLDMKGDTIDYFLDKLIRNLSYLPQDVCDKYWERVVYIDMHGQYGYVVPFPFFYRLGTERSLWEISERYLQVLLRSDPGLADRPIMGWPPMHKMGVYAGMVLSALSFQITEIFDLLRNPEQWDSRFSQARSRYPTVTEAVNYFRTEYIPMRQTDRERLNTALLNKLFPIRLDRRLRAMFGASQPGISFAEAAPKNHMVLMDCRHIQGDMRRFKSQLVIDYLMAYIKSRGRSPTPFAVIFDEFPQMTVNVSSGTNPLAAAFDSLIQAYMRSSQIWLAIGLQSPLQLDEQLRQTVLPLGSYLIGQQTTPAAARILAESVYRLDRYKVWYTRTIYTRVARGEEQPVVSQYMPLDLQREQLANRIRNLRRFQFLLRPGVNEGEIGTAVYPVSIKTVDPGQFPDREVLEPLYPILAAGSGTWVDDLIKEREARLTPHQPQETPRRQGAPRRRSPEPPREETAPEPQDPEPTPKSLRRTIQRRRLIP